MSGIGHKVRFALMFCFPFPDFIDCASSDYQESRTDYF